MKKLIHSITFLSFCICCAACNPQPTTSTNSEISAEEVSQKNKESAELTGKYLDQEKDKFQNKVETQLKALDAQIDELTLKAQKLANDTERKSVESKAEIDKNLAELKAQREKTATELKDFQQNASASWKVAAEKINKSVDKLNEATDRVTQRFVQITPASKKEDKEPK